MGVFADQTKTTGSNNKIKIVYDVELTVQDEDGTAITGYTAVLKDKNGTTVSSLTDVLVFERWNTAPTTETIEYYPFTLVISKAGYETSALKWNINNTTIKSLITLKKALPVMLKEDGAAIRANPTNYGANRELVLLT
jgi:hypothetical protein